MPSSNTEAEMEIAMPLFEAGLDSIPPTDCVWICCDWENHGDYMGVEVHE
jgi:hypothetical protein